MEGLEDPDMRQLTHLQDALPASSALRVFSETESN